VLVLNAMTYLESCGVGKMWYVWCQRDGFPAVSY